MTDFPTRPCAGCDQVDDHPRVNYVAPGGQDEELWHHDCFVLVHPASIEDHPAIHEIAASGLKGDKLREHIQREF